MFSVAVVIPSWHYYFDPFKAVLSSLQHCCAIYVASQNTEIDTGSVVGIHRADRGCNCGVCRDKTVDSCP